MQYDPRFNSENHNIFVVEDFKQPYRINVDGEAPGINSNFAMYPHYTVIVLSNYDPPSAVRVGNKIQQLLMNLEPELFL
ncbi:MAG: hypothetical protein KAU62_09095 [Candidatus Heimdallarchaeota archaeon]|nr:hypothetical protein [Candidatus Heimdallarchaeota archaeon]MCG3256226.1 hypothetical protein [Candidatus Heimdallarchaeota archaeon]MCK4611295.1 hypothetical protein [Candidatus Heimdallarchaeota archaeon]